MQKEDKTMVSHYKKMLNNSGRLPEQYIEEKEENVSGRTASLAEEIVSEVLRQMLDSTCLTDKNPERTLGPEAIRYLVAIDNRSGDNTYFQAVDTPVEAKLGLQAVQAPSLQAA